MARKQIPQSASGQPAPLQLLLRYLRISGLVAVRGLTMTSVGALWLLLSWPGTCWAYIDPNAGGFLAQLLAPLLSVIAAFIFYCRREIAKIIRPKVRKIEQKEEEPQVKP
ncbi:MAG TPA: hypothetical protein VKV28_05330 [Candidatus Binataceae bacterium]|nr:hypothetical protein [Candidatus Binataceae bacterium]